MGMIGMGQPSLARLGCPILAEAKAYDENSGEGV